MSEIPLHPVNEELRKTRPFAAKYARIHGQWNLMSEDWPMVDYVKKGYKNSEAVYKACLKEGKTWEELLEFKPEDMKGIIL